MGMSYGLYIGSRDEQGNFAHQLIAWDKAYALDSWFTEICWSKEDYSLRDGASLVSWYHLHKLKALVEEILEDPEKGMTLLPLEYGDIYEENYMAHLRVAKKFLDKYLSTPTNERLVVYYA